MSSANLSYAEESLNALNSENYKSLIDNFKKTVAANGDKVAFECLGHQISFDQLDQYSDQFASFLSHHTDLVKGDRIAVQMPNITQYPIVVWGILKSGMIVVNTNPMYTVRELLHQFNDSGAKALVVIDMLAEQAKSLVNQTDISTVVTATVMDMLQGPKGTAANASGDGHYTFWQALALGAEQAFEPVSQTMQDVAVLQYTGGTTGVAKGATLTHGNLFSAAAMGIEILEVPAGVREVVIGPMPMYHVYGFSVNVIGVVIKGGMSVLIPDPRDMDGLVKTMAAHKFTSMAGVNTIYAGILSHPDLHTIDFSHVIGVISGGTALLTDLAHQWENTTKSKILEGYGLSETTANLCCNFPDAQQIGAVGKPLSALQMKIVDSEGNTQPTGSSGELLVRGPNVMRDYWQRPEATAESIDPDGWFATGDVALVQEDGFVRIVDRLKDMVIVSGFNVYPNEIEDVMSSHPDIAECACIGVPDDRTGEAVKLFVIKSNINLDTDSIIAYARENLTGYKVPKQIVFMSELPKSPVGKILRRELR